MPLKRTPPASPAKLLSMDTLAPNASAPTTPLLTPSINPVTGTSASLAVPNTQLQHSSSEPSLNITHRKRKRPENDEAKFNDMMAEMSSMMKEFKEQQLQSNEKIDKWCSAAETMKSTVDYLAQKYDTLKEQYDKLQNVRQEDLRYIKTLEDRLESSERTARATCLEIRNIPLTTPETKSSLVEMIITTGKVLNVQIQHNDVKDIFRINTKDPANKTIIVDLCSVLLKEKIIAMYRKFNKSSSKFSTEHLRIGGLSKPIFISENLTSKMKRLFYLARDFAKVNDYKFCWVAHGKIFLRKRENGQLIRVAGEEELCKLTSHK